MAIVYRCFEGAIPTTVLSAVDEQIVKILQDVTTVQCGACSGEEGLMLRSWPLQVFDHGVELVSNLDLPVSVAT